MVAAAAAVIRYLRMTLSMLTVKLLDDAFTFIYRWKMMFSGQVWEPGDVTNVRAAQPND